MAAWITPVTAAVKFAALVVALAGTRTTSRLALGAIACTISVSSTSSVPATQGALAPARVVVTLRFAAGRPNLLSNAARSLRMSVKFGPGRLASSGHYDGLAFAGDPTAQQWRHAVGHPVLAGAVALDEVTWRPARHGPGGRGGLGCAAGGCGRREAAVRHAVKVAAVAAEPSAWPAA
jgi:hypothetical protein